MIIFFFYTISPPTTAFAKMYLINSNLLFFNNNMFLNSVIVTKRTYFCTCCFPCMSRYLFIPVSLKYIIFIVVLLEMPDANLLRCIIKLLRPPRVIYLQISISISGIILILSPAIRIVGRSPRFIRHNKDEVYHYHLSVANYEFC